MNDVLRSALRGHAVTFSSAHPAVLRWVEEYHTPFFEQRRQREPSRPHLHAAPEPPAALARAPAGAAAVRGFLGRALRHWQDASGAHWLDPGRSLISFDGDFLIRFDPGAGGSLFEPPRLLRELLLRKALEGGAVKLKGNVVAGADGRGILMLGRKGAGKTLATVNELLRGGAFVGNSRVMVRAAGAGVEGLGIPISVRVGEDLMRAVGGLARWLASYPEGSQLRLESFDPQVRLRKIEMTPKELAGALAARLVASTPLDEVWYLANEEGGPAPGRASKEAALAHSLINEDPAFPAFWLGRAPAVAPDPEALERLCRLPWRFVGPESLLKPLKAEYGLA